VDPRVLVDSALAGALCDAGTRERVRVRVDAYDGWPVASA
jgi:hypothetical protein